MGEEEHESGKKVMGGSGIAAGGNVTFGDVGMAAIGERITQIQIQGMSENQVREIISNELDPTLNELVILLKRLRYSEFTKEQQMTYELIKEKVNEADQWFDEIVGTPNTYLNLGNIEYDRQNYEKAIDYYDKIIKIQIKNLIAWYNKAFALLSLQRYDEAIRCFDMVLEMEPEHASAEYNKGVALHNLMRYSEAIRCYDKVLEMEPEHSGALTQKAFALHNLGRHNEAIKYYDKALEMEPGRIDIMYNKGLILINLMRYSEAIRCFDKVLEIDPEYANVWYHKASVLHKLRRYDEAIRYYDKILEIDPNHKFAKKNREIAKISSEKSTQNFIPKDTTKKPWWQFWKSMQ